MTQIYTTLTILLSFFVLNLQAVELMDFDAYESDCKVALTWAVTSATDFSHFEIEQSTSGQAFDKVAEITHTYSKKGYDYNEAATANTTYYRLKMVDMDGTYEYSQTLEVNSTCTTAATISNIADQVEEAIEESNVRIQTTNATDASTSTVADQVEEAIEESNVRIQTTNATDVSTSTVADQVEEAIEESNVRIQTSNATDASTSTVADQVEEAIEESNVRTQTANATDAMTIFPNPVSAAVGELNVRFQTSNEVESFTISNIYGQSVMQIVNDNIGESTVRIQISNLETGNYVIRNNTTGVAKQFVVIQ